MPKNENQSFIEKINNIFKRKKYSVLTTIPKDILLEELKQNQENLSEDKIIKILCVIEEYDKIREFISSQFLSSYIRDNDFIEPYNFKMKKTKPQKLLKKISQKQFQKPICTKEELVLASLSCYKTNDVYISNLITLNWGELFYSNHPYFIKNFPEIEFKSYDLIYFTADNLIIAYDNGYKDLIKKNINGINLVTKYNITTDPKYENHELKELIITPELATQLKNYDKFFESLPQNKRELIAYYNYDSNDHHSFIKKTKYTKLSKLFEQKYPEIEKRFQKKIINLYGLLPNNIIAYIINCQLTNKDYLETIENFANKNLDNDLLVTIKFEQKYPELFKKITTTIEVNNELKERIYKLSEIPVLEGINNLTPDYFLKENLENHSYAIDENILVIDTKYHGSPESHIENKLFKYQREIIIFDLNDNIISINAEESHSISLSEFYVDKINDSQNKKMYEIIYKANMFGDILFITENNSLIIWLPPSLTNPQKENIITKLKKISIKEKNNISIGFANPNKTNNHVMLNEGMPMKLDKALEELNRIKVDDNYTYIPTEKNHSNQK